MRAVFEMLGIQDVVAKSIGSQNPYNMVRRQWMDFQKASPRMVAQRRGKRFRYSTQKMMLYVLSKLPELQEHED